MLIKTCTPLCSIILLDHSNKLATLSQVQQDSETYQAIKASYLQISNPSRDSSLPQKLLKM